MHIDSQTGVVTLGRTKLSGGMTPAELAYLPGFRENSGLDDEAWYWTNPLEGYDWTPFFKWDRLCSLHIVKLFTEDPSRKNRADDLLTEMLGAPHDVFPVGKRGPQAILWLAEAARLRWVYDWGEVHSTIEPRDWTSLVLVTWTQFTREA